MSLKQNTTAESADASVPEDVILYTEDLTKRFGDLVAVSSVDLQIESGDVYSVIGPNGAGKTTLFNLITGWLSPSRGRVVFDGTDVTDYPAHERVQRGMTRSFQITNVFEGLTVQENVRLAVQSAEYPSMGTRETLLWGTDRFEEIERRTKDVLAQVELLDRADMRANEMAYGDKRRLEVGLILATDPALVLLDEPTAGMSSDETNETIDLITDVLEDRTLLVVEHDVDLVMNISDRIIALNYGEVIAQGTPTEIANDDAVQEAYLGSDHDR
jgi:branched-chain amino acid transport system ATP-binding protein